MTPAAREPTRQRPGPDDASLRELPQSRTTGALLDPGTEDVVASAGVRLEGERVVAGGFADLYLDMNGNGALDLPNRETPGDLLTADNFFLHTGLPESALSAGGAGHGVGAAFAD